MLFQYLVESTDRMPGGAGFVEYDYPSDAMTAVGHILRGFVVHRTTGIKSAKDCADVASRFSVKLIHMPDIEHTVTPELIAIGRMVLDSAKVRNLNRLRHLRGSINDRAFAEFKCKHWDDKPVKMCNIVEWKKP